MESVVLLTSLLRVLLISVVYLLNVRALVGLSVGRLSAKALTSGAVLVANLVYLTSWAPYLIYGLANGRWVLLSAGRHCVLQHFISTEAGTVLLCALAVRALDGLLTDVYRKPARMASVLICAAWVGPQLVYDTFSREEDGGGSYRFLDDVLVVPPRGVNATQGYRVGFMICLQSLSERVLGFYIWQYAVVVLPLGSLILFCWIRHFLLKRRKSMESLSQTEKDPEKCSKEIDMPKKTQGTFLDMALGYNFLWLFVLRPLALLHSIYIQPLNNWDTVYYLDFGSHLVLAFSSVFSPLSFKLGLWSKSKSEDKKNILKEPGESIC